MKNHIEILKGLFLKRMALVATAALLLGAVGAQASYCPNSDVAYGYGVAARHYGIVGANYGAVAMVTSTPAERSYEYQTYSYDYYGQYLNYYGNLYGYSAIVSRPCTK